MLTEYEGEAMKPQEEGASAEIDDIICRAESWKKRALSESRSVILSVDRRIVEEVKWKKPSNPYGIPVWSMNGIICFANVLKNAVRLTFPKGTQIDDPQGLFNERLNSKTVRAIDFYEDSEIDDKALSALVRSAIEVNARLRGK